MQKLICLSLILLPLATHAAVVNGFYFMGASNMNSRRTSASQLPPNLQSPQPDVYYNYSLDAGSYQNPGNYTTLRPTAGNYPSSSNGTGFGAEVVTGRRLTDHFSSPVAVIKNGTGSSRLATNWAPGGAEYNRFLGQHFEMEAGMSALGDTLKPHTVYMQLGENDVINSTYAGQYETNLRSFISQLRFDLNAPQLRFVIQKTYWPRGGASYSNGLQQVRTAQENIAASDPLVSIISADDLAFSTDNVHFTSASEMEIGERFYNATQVPEPSSATLLGLGCFTLLLHRKK